MTTFQKIILILFVLLVAGWFYWFQYRPTQIRQGCEQKVYDLFKGKHLGMSINQVLELRKSLYDFCLHKKGL